MEFKYKRTDRNFAVVEFTDHYGVECSLQESSLASDEAVWLGPDKPNPRILVSDAVRLGLPTNGEHCGWVDYTMPKEVLTDTRMHLTRNQVKALLPILQQFADSGQLPTEEGEVVKGVSPNPTALQPGGYTVRIGSRDLWLHVDGDDALRVYTEAPRPDEDMRPSIDIDIPVGTPRVRLYAQGQDLESHYFYLDEEGEWQ